MPVVICFHISIFDISETTVATKTVHSIELWFAFILVSLTYRKQLYRRRLWLAYVVICFHISIFDISETTLANVLHKVVQLWFAFILVSLTYRKQPTLTSLRLEYVVICFHISIFDISETTILSALALHR